MQLAVKSLTSGSGLHNIDKCDAELMSIGNLLQYLWICNVQCLVTGLLWHQALRHTCTYGPVTLAIS